MLKDLIFLVGTFSMKDRASLLALVCIQFVVSLMDLLGLAAVLPLMQVLTGADLESGYIGTLYHIFGSPGRAEFVLWMSGVMVLAFLVKAVVGLVVQWWSLGLVVRLQVGTATKLLSAYMSEDYLTHRQRDTGEVIRTVEASVGDAHSKVLGGILSLTSSALSIVLIVGLLVAVTPVVTAVALVYFGGLVYLLQRLLSGRNYRAGRESNDSAWIKSLALINAMHGFREIKMHDAEALFVSRYELAAIDNGTAGRKAGFYSAVPRYVLELMSISGIALILAVVLFAYDPAEMMPALTLFVAATVKLLPTMSGVTTTLGIIRGGIVGLALAVNAIKAMPVQEANEVPAGGIVDAAGSPLTLDVAGVTFRYPDGNRNVLEEIQLKIPGGSSLALCGSSGSGKTTLVDVMLGLIEPDAGSVTYGGVSTFKMGEAWHATVAYVPQDVYLLQDTLAANVAFGDSVEERDESRILAALERAQLSDLVADMPDGLESLVGERGSRLSGGQRQRIGIARALYRDPKVVVFDEATSALDNETEDQISRTIRSLRGQITTIIVAHRLSTVRHVDQLAFIEAGRVSALGSFSEVRRQSRSFNRMVELGRLDDEVGPGPIPMSNPEAQG